MNRVESEWRAWAERKATRDRSPQPRPGGGRSEAPVRRDIGRPAGQSAPTRPAYRAAAEQLQPARNQPARNQPARNQPARASQAWAAPERGDKQRRQDRIAAEQRRSRSRSENEGGLAPDEASALSEGANATRRKRQAREAIAEPSPSSLAAPSTVPAEHKRVIKINRAVSVQELAKAMGIKATALLKQLWSLGSKEIMLNSTLDADTASVVAGEFGYRVQDTSFREEQVLGRQEEAGAVLRPRAPAVTVMGHVDHGKTTLLDAVRQTRVAAGEAGGITQHIAAYRVSAGPFGEVVFLDTPGHQAFTAMRARGAQATDIVVLVVAADDGAMPQTLEALEHARAARVPIIVAVTKVDLPNARPERVRLQLMEHGLVPEEWGGQTQFVEVCAPKGQGIERLLEAIALQAELLELRAVAEGPASGLVLEGRLERGRGPVATVLVKRGTLRLGDWVVAGEHVGKVRCLLDEGGRNHREAGPSMPAEVLGLDGVPEAGDRFDVVADKEAATAILEHRRQRRQAEQLGAHGQLTLAGLMEKIQRGESKELKVVLKGDVKGTTEALRGALAALSAADVRLEVVHAGVGGVSESDVQLACASGAVIVGFRVCLLGRAAALAEELGVEIKLYEVIYTALEEMQQAMIGLLPPIEGQHELGRLEVRQRFHVPKLGGVAGCMVIEGKVRRGARARVVRDGQELHDGAVRTLRRFKQDITEVGEGYECGLMLEGFDAFHSGDMLWIYQRVQEPAALVR